MKYEEVVKEERGSQGPRYLKVTFKYELDSKEGPSCCEPMIIHV